jgi:hypothetical protein
MGTIFDRIKEAGSKDDLFRGPAQVWNLPFCIVAPTEIYRLDDLEGYLAYEAHNACSNMKDKKGKGWPLK